MFGLDALKGLAMALEKMDAVLAQLTRITQLLEQLVAAQSGVRVPLTYRGDRECRPHV
jgi:hypothetical protein